MSGRPDPLWIAMALRVYSACLWLYPAVLRHEHGVEMKQVFRERCREVARGESSAFRVLLLELMPDTLASAGAAHLAGSLDEMRPRQYWALGLLCCAAIGLLLHEPLSHYTLDLAFDAKYWLRNTLEAREQIRHERLVRSVADQLAGEPALESKALAGYLYRSLYSGRERLAAYPDDQGGNPHIASLAADGERAAVVTTDILGSHLSAYPLAVAVQSCLATQGCNLPKAIGQLTERDPDNAFGWTLAFKLASLKEDQAAMRSALGRIASSLYYENYQARITRDLLASAQRSAPGDIELLAAVATQARHGSWQGMDNFRNDVRYHCRALHAGLPYQSRWREQNPDVAGDCLRVAALFTRSGDLWTSRWGWRQLAAESGKDGPLARQLRDSEWLWEQGWKPIGVTTNPDHSWREWNDEQWQQWSAAWSVGDGEIPAMKRWLVSQGIPTSAPVHDKASGP